MSKDEGKKKDDYAQHINSRGGCTRTNWKVPCTNVEHCGRSPECTDKFKTGFFPRRGFALFRKKR